MLAYGSGCTTPGRVAAGAAAAGVAMGAAPAAAGSPGAGAGAAELGIATFEFMGAEPPDCSISWGLYCKELFLPRVAIVPCYFRREDCRTASAACTRAYRAAQPDRMSGFGSNRSQFQSESAGLPRRRAVAVYPQCQEVVLILGYVCLSITVLAGLIDEDSPLRIAASPLASLCLVALLVTWHFRIG